MLPLISTPTERVSTVRVSRPAQVPGARPQYNDGERGSFPSIRRPTEPAGRRHRRRCCRLRVRRVGYIDDPKPSERRSGDSGPPGCDAGRKGAWPGPALPILRPSRRERSRFILAPPIFVSKRELLRHGDIEIGGPLYGAADHAWYLLDPSHQPGGWVLGAIVDGRTITKSRT